MRYLGGKSAMGKTLAHMINGFMPVTYIEPFVGAGNVAQYVRAKQLVLSDVHPDLIAMWNALLTGWQPPDYVSEELYQQLKTQSPTALRGFVGFACSHSGKFFGGYARSRTENRNFAKVGKDSLARKIKNFQKWDIEFSRRDYTYYTPNSVDSATVIYCDPPYFNTTEYTNKFDHAAFWQWVRDMSERCVVLVSEYTAPDDMAIVYEQERRMVMRDKNGNKQIKLERVFTPRNSVSHKLFMELMDGMQEKAS